MQYSHDYATDPFRFLDLQVLRWWTETFIVAILQSTRKMPYGMRYLARETLAAVRVSPSNSNYLLAPLKYTL
jgi:Ras GTPase-activating-like protein IQGAP2/3